MALLLRIDGDVHGVLALDQVQCPTDREFIDGLAPFTTTVAAVMRQFQDDLSSSQVGAVIDHIAEGVLTFDEAGRVCAMNGAAEQLFGYNVNDIEGKRISILVAEPLASELDAQLAASGVLRVTYPGREFEGRRKDGTVFPMQVSLSDIEVQGRKLFIAITRDMTDFKAREQSAEQDRANTETLEQLARIDAVTTIANRRYFDETLEKEVRRAAREQNSLALVFCDIDFFKAFNMGGQEDAGNDDNDDLALDGEDDDGAYYLENGFDGYEVETVDPGVWTVYACIILFLVLFLLLPFFIGVWQKCRKRAKKLKKRKQLEEQLGYKIKDWPSDDDLTVASSDEPVEYEDDNDDDDLIKNTTRSPVKKRNSLASEIGRQRRRKSFCDDEDNPNNNPNSHRYLLEP